MALLERDSRGSVVMVSGYHGAPAVVMVPVPRLAMKAEDAELELGGPRVGLLRLGGPRVGGPGGVPSMVMVSFVYF